MSEELWEILVPCTTNDGVDIDISYHRKWDDQVRNITGGLTILKTAKGIWESPTGAVFKEKMVPVRISCSEEQISEILDITARHYGQLAVMAYQISRRVIIRHY